MGKFKMFGMSVGGITLTLVIVFALGLLGLGWDKFFLPKQENIKRDVYVNTQSYVSGKIQDISKYYNEYNKADAVGKGALRQIIITQFAEFDESKIKSQTLRGFLISMRGY